jgi:aspartate aminotransferase
MDPKDCPELQNMKVAFKERRDLLISLMKEIPGIKINTPDGAFYLFINIDQYYGKSDGVTKINDCNDMSMYLMNKAYVALVPGAAFGNPDCIRFSYATSKELIIEAVSRIKKALLELN